MKELKYKEIIQFSPIRTGSTLVYNIVKNILGNVTKTHGHKNESDNLYVVTIRHPYNSIISKAMVFKEEINLDTIKKYAKIYLDNGGRIIADDDFDKPNVILLYYEDFFLDTNLIIKKLEEKINIKIDEEIKIKLVEEFNITNMEIISNSYDNFDFYDKETHIHGNHISKYKGLTDYTNILGDEELNYLKNDIELNKIIKKYYDDN